MRIPKLISRITLTLCAIAACPLIGISQEPGTATSASASGGHSSTNPQAEVVLVGAGDIASCDNLPGGEATAKLLDKTSGTVFAAGDLAYEDGSSGEFVQCYEKTWGRHKARTRPAVGNHEYHTEGAAGYFEFWGEVAGKKGEGWYSYELGAWHIVVINSNCQEVGGCQVGSPQEKWLRHDLGTHRGVCTLAYWHHPLFSSGVKPEHAMRPELKPIWQDLYTARAAIIVNGHEHNYERFAPQDPSGKADPDRGIREIVVGTGGRNHKPLGIPLVNSEIRNDSTYGVLKLSLLPDKYSWQFIPEAGATFEDSGNGTCHKNGD